MQVRRSATEADVSGSDEQKLTLFASSPETELDITSQMYNLYILASWTSEGSCFLWTKVPS